MKIFNKVVGCPEALFHCTHRYGTRIRQGKAPASGGGCEHISSVNVYEKRKYCCKCGWRSGWIGATMSSSGLIN